MIGAPPNIATLRLEVERLRSWLTEIRDGDYEDVASCVRIAKVAL